MRSSFSYLLIATMIVGSVYWYQDTKHLCPVPLAYRIGDIDQSFDLSYEAARARAAVAEEVWETGTGVSDLFVYDESADFTINYVFDERQVLTETEATKRTALDEAQVANEALFAEIEQRERSYDEARQAYERELQSYEARLGRYNQRVDQYNNQGGAPEEVFAELEAERQALATIARTLDATTDSLNQQIAELNQRGETATKAVEAYNQLVEAYNEQFGFSREFTQGDYQGDRINIYTFATNRELERVLAHEFGHALGIDHVDGEDSVMYYLLKETDQSLRLAEADLAAFINVCGDREDIPAHIRRIIRTILIAII